MWGKWHSSSKKNKIWQSETVIKILYKINTIQIKQTLTWHGLK